MEIGASPTGAAKAERTRCSHQRATTAPARRSKHAETTAQNDPTARISNRQWKILEFTVTRRKQTTAPHPNRHFFRVVRVTNRAVRVAGSIHRMDSAGVLQRHPDGFAGSRALRRRFFYPGQTFIQKLRNSLKANEKIFSNRYNDPSIANFAVPRQNVFARCNPQATNHHSLIT
ncbi:MAG: hypothetical protein WA886_15000, partial [Candidatus Acidiferrales bacterium]